MAVSWVGGTTATWGSAASITAAAPSGLATGDLLLAFVFARSTLTTPSGWSLVVGTSFSNGSTQLLRCYKKTAVTPSDSGADFTFAQAVSGRIGVTFAALRGADIIETSTAVVSNEYTYTITPASLSPAEGTVGAMYLVAASTYNQETTAQTPTFPAGFTRWSGDALAGGYRVAGAYRSTSSPDVISGLVDMSDGDDGAFINGLGALTLMIYPAAATDPEAIIEVPGPLGAPAAQVWSGSDPVGFASAPSPLGGVMAFAVHDFTGLIDAGATYYYVCDLVDGGAATRVQVSSWQGTLQLDGSSYLQAVIPAVEDLADLISGLSLEAEFVIYRGVRLSDGRTIESEMSRSVIDNTQFDEGPFRYTCTMSGYSGAILPPDVEYSETDRVLVDVRSISRGSGGVRVRCAVDWFLKPGQVAVLNDVPFVVGYLNLYGLASDSYMDVGE